MVQAWPFTAREDDVATALAALDEYGTVILGGPAGVGKSRLAHEVAARAGDVVGTVRATASSHEIPLGAFSDVLSSAGPGRAMADLIQVHDAVQSLEQARAGQVLVVDDAHLLDDVSATVVHRIATGGRLRMVLTLRSGERTPDAVVALWKDHLAARLEIEPFDPTQTSSVLAAALDGVVEAQSARRLQDTTRGNVLWLRHLVDGERAAGRLRRQQGVWDWAGEVTLSPALADLLTTRIGVLTDRERRVLDLLAVSEPLSLGMLEELAEAGPVEEVAQRGLVTVERDGERWEVRLAHPLYGESVRARTSVPRARRLRGELSAALASTGGRRAGDGLRRAVLDLGSDRVLDPGVLLAAAMQASGLGDFALAERLVRAAIEAGGGFEARAGLAHLLTYLLRSDEAESVLAEAVASATTPQERTRAVSLRMVHAHVQATVPRNGEPILRQAEAEFGDGRRDPAYDAVRAIVLAGDGHVEEALDLAEAVVGDGARPTQSVAWAGWIVCLGRTLTGRDDVATAVEQAISAASRSPETVAMQCNIGFFEILDADLRARPETARARMDWVRSLSGAHAPVFVALYEARLAMSAGLPRAAVRMLEGIIPTFTGHAGGWGPWLVAMTSQCHAMLGDAAAARRALADAEERRHPFLPVLDFEIDLARGWTAAAGGNTRAAVEQCRRGAERCAAFGTHAAEVLLRQAAVRFGDRDQVGRLDELHRRLGTPRAALASAHAAALAAQDAARLLEVAAALEEAGMGLEGADAAGQAAAVAREQRRLVLAAEAEERARALAVTGDDARTPALVAAEAPVALSSREREVAVLAGEGLTNRQIAERLHVSVRTVESHVYRACSRLGLPDRAAFVVVAGGRKP